MLTLFLVSILWGGLYVFIAWIVASTWQKQDSLGNQEDSAIRSISILIVIRNEERHIANCLKSISHNEYPKDQYEIIVVDDHSEDRSAEIIQNLGIENLRLLRLSDYDLRGFQGRYKKAWIP